MAIVTLDASALGDVNPYVLPAGWVNRVDAVKIQSGAIRGAYAIDSFSAVVVENPLTSGWLDITFAVSQANNISSDASGAAFLTTAGNGYAVLSTIDRFSVREVSSGALVPGSVGVTGNLVWSAGAQFRVRMEIATGNIEFYQNSVSTSTPSATFTGLTFLSGMAQGLGFSWENSNQAGIVAASAIAADSSATTVDSLADPLSPSGTYTVATTGLTSISAAASSFGGVPLASASAAGGDGTITIQGWVHGSTYPQVPGTYNVILSDGTASATVSRTMSLPSGYLQKDIASVNTGPNSLGKDPAIIDGVRIFYPDLGPGAFNADGTFSNVPFGTYTFWMRDLSGFMWTFSLVLSNSTIVEGGSITSRSITSRSVTSRKLTLRRLA